MNYDMFNQSLILYLNTAADFDCDFEIDTCTWKQSTTDNFDWTRHAGDTPSTQTGPHGDHTDQNGK